MLNSKSFLAVDFGAANLKLAEFEINEAGGLLLKQYGLRSMGQEGAQEATRESAVLSALQGMLAEHSYGSKSVNICAPGFHTFSKFVKLPPVDTSKVTQIIQYEAQQNVPFPLEEVVWDYQILGSNASGELEVLLVAIKSDIVEGLSKVCDSAGLRLQLVDVSPAALCNAFRYNYGDLEGCTMLLDIGAKTSNLLFFEKGNMFSRSINIGANAITQDFAKEAGLNFTEAEKLKIEEGFVSLGGAYEEPENPNQAAISKIARQVMTRLHIQVNQTIQFYRQQGGTSPQQLFLSGGAAIMPYTAQFFAEKLNLPVDYFNPLRNVQLDLGLNIEELQKVAHSFGEVVGLGLRNLAHCPVEMNLMPRSSIQRQQLKQKQPYLLAAACCLVMILYAFGWFYGKVADDKSVALEQLKAKVDPLKRNEQPLQSELSALTKAQTELQSFSGLVQDRIYWGRLLSGLRDLLISVEGQQEEALKTKVGVWVERFTPMTLAGPVFPGSKVDVQWPPGTNSAPAAAAPTKRKRPEKNTSAAAAATTAQAGENEIGYVVIDYRGVNIATPPSANTAVAAAVRDEMAKATNYFDADGTTLAGTLVPDGNGLTFKFSVIAKLKTPIKY
ncbi:MAG: Type pilus assembly protein PilM [Verrucomicrobiales bacterium]|nr:Type pilus assembly protein PilM [Verrucomicrobiales bacterium]